MISPFLTGLSGFRKQILSLSSFRNGSMLLPAIGMDTSLPSSVSLRNTDTSSPVSTCFTLSSPCFLLYTLRNLQYDFNCNHKKALAFFFSAAML